MGGIFLLPGFFAEGFFPARPESSITALEMTAVGAFFNKLVTSHRSRKEGAALGQQPPFRHSIGGRPRKPAPQVRKQPG